MKNELLKVSVRQNAIYVPLELAAKSQKGMNQATSLLSANAARLGFAFSEPLLHAINAAGVPYTLEILTSLKEISGVGKNWTPLVKGWDTPTGETVIDHIITLFANVFHVKGGTTLACGHTIPVNTFPLERYNGCPFCGTPFEFGKIENYGQGSKLKVLELWTEQEAEVFLKDLLSSKTALDATQVDSLKILLAKLPLPEVNVTIKETMMIVIDHCAANGLTAAAQKYFQSPVDIMRYLWYKKTGFLQIIEPKTIVKNAGNVNFHVAAFLNVSAKVELEKKAALKLKYSRRECLMVATWLNNLEMDAEKCCELMHPKRRMWVRMIRALRLAEYSHKAGFEKLAHLMDIFYNQVYEVWQGQVEHYRLRADAEKTFNLLKQRPSMFARSLFANMLWFGPEEAIAAFEEIIDKVPARLVFTLHMYADNYFNPNVQRSVKTLGGTNKRIRANQLLQLYNEEQLTAIKGMVENLCLFAMKKRFEALENSNKTMYIHPMLYNMPVSIGDRSGTVQDLPVALMGTRFPVEGENIRLFMQWGSGLHAQHMDMDLSCYIAYESKMEFCSFSNLVATGCKHSGDMRSIPDKVGTAEYVEIDLAMLQKAGAKYVSFTCNAYSLGAITPQLVVGWMNSRFPMKISEKTGVAYDPSCVQHQVRVTQSIAKGLVFGVLDVQQKEVIWCEMTFGGQVVQSLDYKGVQALLHKLASKLNIGALLSLKAEAQGLTLVQTVEEADEKYDQVWAMNAAAVTQLLVD